MSRQRESRLSSKIIKELNKHPGIFCWKNHGSEFTLAGLPDIIGVGEGMFFGLEVKLPESRENVSPVQRHVHHQLRSAGGFVAVVCSVAEATDAMIRLLGERYEELRD